MTEAAKPEMKVGKRRARNGHIFNKEIMSKKGFEFNGGLANSQKEVYPTTAKAPYLFTSHRLYCASQIADLRSACLRYLWRRFSAYRIVGQGIT